MHNIPRRPDPPGQTNPTGWRRPSLKSDRITIFSTHLLDLAVDLCDEIVLLSHGVLEAVAKSNLDDQEFKEKIIAALKEEAPEGGRP